MKNHRRQSTHEEGTEQPRYADYCERFLPLWSLFSRQEQKRRLMAESPELMKTTPVSKTIL